MSAFETVLRVLSTITTILLCVSPWPDYRRIIQERSTGLFSILPVLTLLVNAHVWNMYGYLTRNFFPLFTVCTFGCITCLLFIGVYYKFSSAEQRATLHRWFVLAIVLIVGWTTYVIVATATGRSDDDVGTVLGYFCVAITICVYASPMATVATVLKTKSAASLPLTMCVVNLTNSLLWVVLGVLISDYVVLVSNAVGGVLSFVQVALCWIYRPSKVVDGGDFQTPIKENENVAVRIDSPVSGATEDAVASEFQAQQSPREKEIEISR